MNDREQMKADLHEVETCVLLAGCAKRKSGAAFDRLRARLEAVPDEDAVTEAVQQEAAGWATFLSDFEARQVAIAAIAAINGETK